MQTILRSTSRAGCPVIHPAVHPLEFFRWFWFWRKRIYFSFSTFSHPFCLAFCWHSWVIRPKVSLIRLTIFQKIYCVITVHLWHQSMWKYTRDQLKRKKRHYALVHVQENLYQYITLQVLWKKKKNFGNFFIKSCNYYIEMRKILKFFFYATLNQGCNFLYTCRTKNPYTKKKKVTTFIMTFMLNFNKNSQNFSVSIEV